jgi:crotonobetainyl-CoA:carnitine CoA-transferase CaiB-like acyl-CoA transferase
VKLSDTPGEITRAASALGADSDAVLREFLGYPDDRIERLRGAKVIS